MSTIARAAKTAPTSPMSPDRKKVTISTLRLKKEQVAPITMLTAYDYPTAVAEDQAGIDAILVGDSLVLLIMSNWPCNCLYCNCSFIS